MYTLETAEAAMEHLYADALSPAARAAFSTLWEGTDEQAERDLLRAVEPDLTVADVVALRFRLETLDDLWDRRARLVGCLDPWVLGTGVDPREDRALRPLVARAHAERQAAALRAAFADVDPADLDAALEGWD